MEDIKQKILVALIGECPEDYNPYNNSYDDERVWFYKDLEKRLGIPKKYLQPNMIELRNDGLVELIRGLVSPDGDSGYYGSGWVLTPPGVIEAKKYLALGWGAKKHENFLPAPEESK